MEPKRRSDHGRMHHELTSVADEGAQTADLGPCWRRTARHFRTIGEEAKTQSGFADLDSAYVPCIEALGFDFTDPSDILSEEIMGAEFMDSEARIADIECRAPLYEAFIELSTPIWAEWLDRRDGDIAVVEAIFAQWESVALDAWSAGQASSSDTPPTTAP